LINFDNPAASCSKTGQNSYALTSNLDLANKEIDWGRFNVTVYSVKKSDIKPDPFIFKWPTSREDKLYHELLNSILNYEPPHSSKIKILVVGAPGTGKTAFYNTIKVACTKDDKEGKMFEPLTNEIASGEDHVTLHHKIYDMTDYDTNLKWPLFLDTPGNEGTNYENNTFIKFMFEGRVCHNFPMKDVNFFDPFNHPKINKANISWNEDVSVLIMVIKASDVDSKKSWSLLKPFQTVAKEKGVPRMVVITHPDDEGIVPSLREDASLIQGNQLLGQIKALAVKNSGEQPFSVHLILNYHNDRESDFKKNYLALKILDAARGVAHCRIKNILSEKKREKKSETENK